MLDLLESFTDPVIGVELMLEEFAADFREVLPSLSFIIRKNKQTKM